MVLTGSELWNKVQHALQSNLSKPTFETWIRPARCSSFQDRRLTLQAPNRFASNWLRKNYVSTIAEVAQEITGHPIEVIVLAQDDEEPVAGSAPEARVSPSSQQALASTGAALAAPSNSAPRRLPGLNMRYVFNRFVVGPNSRMAHAAALAVAEAPGREFNPLFICGGVGLGKTHLMQAIGHYRLEIDPEARVFYVSTETFTNDLITAIRKDGMQAFRDRYRAADLILIDDIQFLAGKERIQEEFFHTFNEIYEAQRQILLTSDRPAGEIDKIESRLLSRFQWGLVADIQAPDLETRVAILSKKADAMGISVEPEIIEFLAKNISRNVRRMEGALTRVAGYVGLTRKKADLETVQRLLRDILREENLSRITIETIQKKVVDYYHLRMADMLSRRRPANIAFPRQVAMYLSRILTEHSLQEIGGAFGGRDHGTVIHACKTVENMMDQDTSIKHSVEFLNEQLSQSME